jgi:hypothetical protein
MVKLWVQISVPPKKKTSIEMTFYKDEILLNFITFFILPFLLILLDSAEYF